MEVKIMVDGLKDEEPMILTNEDLNNDNIVFYNRSLR